MRRRPLHLAVPAGAVALAMLAAAPLTGCGAACNDIAVASLVVNVEDAAGNPVCDAQVVAIRGDERFPMTARFEPCSYGDVAEQTGEFVVEVTDASGAITTSDAVTVRKADECHVRTETVNIRLGV